MYKYLLPVLAVALLGAGCTAEQSTNVNSVNSEVAVLESNILDESVDDLRGAFSYLNETDEGTVYTSSIYSFEVMLPVAWGSLNEIVSDGPTDAFEAAVTLSSIEDPNRFITVYVVKYSSLQDSSVIDLPAVRVGEIKDRYAYHISSGGDYYGLPGVTSETDKSYFNEVEGVRASFQTTI